MVIRGQSAFRPGKRHWRYLVIMVLCALFRVADATDEQHDEQSQRTTPEADATEKTMPEIRIKRLKPADPESTEVMLAARSLDYSGHRVS